MSKKITYNGLTGDVMVDLTPHLRPMDLSEYPNVLDEIDGEAAYKLAIEMINDRKVGEFKLPAGTKVGKLTPLETFERTLKGMTSKELDRLVRNTVRHEAMIRYSPPTIPSKQRSNAEIDAELNKRFGRR